MSSVQPERVRMANTKPFDQQAKRVVYWMQASQRVEENPALAYALTLANEHKKELVVYFCITPYPSAQKAHYEFMLEGLSSVASDLARNGIQFIVEQKNALVKAVSDFARDACCLVADENYVRVPRQWREEIAQALPVQMIVVDGNLIVPAAILGKEEWAAYTIRPKLWARAQYFLQPVSMQTYHKKGTVENSVPKLHLELSNQAKRTQNGGEQHARKALTQFIDRVSEYSNRNDPTLGGTSKLSAYLHFGQISPVTIVNTVSAATTPRTETETQAFIEQVFVRREVAHNFTFYQPHYDTLSGCPKWAQETLKKHERDPRDYIYSLNELEEGKTHDELWNAAQQEMRKTGYMHNYMRMLWAKKILEWSETPQIAMQNASTLNDRYELDGRDPNGYTGIAWSIGGKHDRPWFDRAVYGTVRYMSTTAAAKKFNAKAYVQQVENA